MILDSLLKQAINNFDKIIGVISDNDLKISRLLSRGMAKLSITNIMKNQLFFA